MNIITPMIEEMKNEAVNTRKLLSRVPDDKLGWTPHTKSMSLGRLATHIAEIQVWAAAIMTEDRYAFDPGEYKPVVAENRDRLLAMLDEGLEACLAAMDGRTDEHMLATWKMSMGDQVIIELPRFAAMRALIFNHLIHHRGQLTVYLRMNDVPLPAICGPSADEDPA